MIRLTQISALALLLCCASYAQRTHKDLSTEESVVMGVMVDGFRDGGRASHPIVADYTSTYDCAAICNGMKIGRCNGLANNDETPAERLAIVKRDMPDVEQATLSDFEAKNLHCSKIRDKPPSQSPSFLFGEEHAEKLPSGWEHADFFYFSRVGFNAQGTQALINVSFMSGTNSGNSGGKYFLLFKEAGKWVPKESSVVWQMTAP
ncbi:MAG: hypothetical protein WCC87_25125 [Candidatus Korobacteraceae bacterium]